MNLKRITETDTEDSLSLLLVNKKTAYTMAKEEKLLF
jgi:hypothetical protein